MDALARDIGDSDSVRSIGRIRRFWWLFLPLIVSFVSLVVAITAHFAHRPALTSRAVHVAADSGLWGVALLAVIALVSVLWWLSVRGPSAAEGYWNQRDKTRRTFRGEWTHTGYLNWDTGLGSNRWHLQRYWPLALAGPLTIATSTLYGAGTGGQVLA